MRRVMFPYWVSPLRRGIDRETKEAAIMVDVAPSRAERKTKGRTVVIRLSELAGQDVMPFISARVVEAAQALNAA